MKTINLKLAALVVTAALGLTSCKKEFGAKGDFNKSSKAPINYDLLPKVHLSGVYTGNRVLSPDTLYLLDGVVYFSGSSANLYIKAGTHVVTGNAVTYAGRSLKGVLVIAKDAQIFADGNKSNVSEASYNPDSTIVFGPEPSNTSPAPGDFGGVILLGNAPTNAPTTTVIEGIPTSPPADVTYGGSASGDNSGVLRFARIEYAGFLLSTDNEINGLTLGGVGSGTTLSHIQVSRSNDDSFEFFGGTVNGDHLVALAGTDDDFDFDNGYTGTLSYCIALKDPGAPNTTSGGTSDSNGIESDNNAGSTAATPLTKPTVDHFTILGYSSTTNITKLENGAHFRRLSGVNVQNSIIAGFPNGVRFENITSTGSTFQDNVVHGFTTAFITTGPTFTSNKSYTDVFTNLSPAENSYLGLAGGEFAFYDRTASYNPENLTPAASPTTDGGSSGNFVGAIDPSLALWTANWTKFDF